MECYKRALKVFSVDNETVSTIMLLYCELSYLYHFLLEFDTELFLQLRIWDFSGQTALYCLNDQNKTMKDSERQSEQDVCVAFPIILISFATEVFKLNAVNLLNAQYSPGNHCEP